MASVGRGRTSAQPTHDVVVVGAGFAGLACAKRAAERGLRTLVIEQQPAPARHLRTTGILVEEAQAQWPAPPHLVRRIDRVRLYAPSHRCIDLAARDYRFLATDTAGLLRFLVREALQAGAQVRFATPFRGLSALGNRLSIDGAGVSCRYLVGADGVNSKVAKCASLGRNTHLLKGVEWEYEALGSAGDSLHCFVDPERAPGYIGWVVPGVGITQVGLAVDARRKPDLPRFVQRIDHLFGLSGHRVQGKRGGWIPTNGLLRRFHRGRVLLVGDAAGMVSPLTGGGIHHAYRYGRLAGDALAEGIEGGPVSPGDIVQAAYRSAPWKHAARWCYDHLPVARALETGLLTGTALRRIAGKVFFG